MSRNATVLIQSGAQQFLEQPTIILTDDSGAQHHFEHKTVRVGAGPGNDFRLAHETISSVHLEIEVRLNGFRIRDLGSTNGTYVNGVRIESAWLEPGSKIMAGQIPMTFSVSSEKVKSELTQETNLGQAVGQSASMRVVFSRVQRAAKTNATILLRGETGTGKEVIAGTIWERSSRAEKPFVVIDCGAISRSLIESELFGHEKGAFTGAEKKRRGAFERAHGGTVFLDELGELPLELQPKLLRVLESKTIQRLGSEERIPVDVRVIAATHRDLRTMVAKGDFREDLYYRLAVVELELPALRERKEDIPLLVESFVQDMGAQMSDLPETTLQQFAKYDWPGNCRELRNAVERMMILGQVDLNRDTPAAGSPGDTSRLEIDLERPYKSQKQQHIAQFERAYVIQLIQYTSGNVSKAGRIAGIDRMSLHKIMSRYELDVPTILAMRT